MASPKGGKSRKPASELRNKTETRAIPKARPGAGRRPVTTRLKFPIALKFAVFIAVLAVASMAWQARTAIRLAGDRLEEEINRSGIQLVTTLSILLRHEWLVNLVHQDQIIELLRRFEASRGTRNVKRIVVFNRMDEPIALSRASMKVTADPRVVDYEPAKRAGVRITEGEADNDPVRMFSRVIYGDPRLLEGPAGKETEGVRKEPPPLPASDVRLGRVEVFLSAKHISDSRRSLSRQLIQVSLIACTAATIASFLLGRFLSRSIRALVKDMKQVSQGNLQHESSVDSGDELGDLARTFNLMTSNLQAAQETKLAQKAMEHELSVATRIQHRLLPSRVPQANGIELGVFYLSAKEVGGDYYDFIPIDSQHLGMVVADVSGKGVPGSLVMTMTRSLLRMAAARQTAPDRPVRQVNRCLAPDMNPGMFVTLLYLIVNTSSKEVSLVRAGHNAPLLYSRRHRKVIQLHPRGIAIGLDQRGSLFQSELEVQRFRLCAGDVFVAYTDGIIEGKNAKGEDFGEERLSQLISTHQHLGAQEIVDAVTRDLAEHQKGVDRSDDITLLVMKSS